MAANSVEEIFHAQLQDAYSAETQLVKALPKMAKAATSAELKSGFKEHLEQTKGHVSRLKEACRIAGCKTGGETCEAMEGLIEEGGEMIEMDVDENARDVGLIIAAQKVEHYEIALYGGLCTLAKLLGQNEIATLLAETLEEEKQTDAKLTRLATEQVNSMAMA